MDTKMGHGSDTNTCAPIFNWPLDQLSGSWRIHSLTPSKDGVVPEPDAWRAEGADDDGVKIETLDEHPEERG